ncbi:MAG TPA: hypothetical protein VLF64_02945 [Candidatus Saccharimonadales bacterium]|nr:hypothetical protein [Candidatus Saccharimonadales bacterium]
MSKHRRNIFGASGGMFIGMIITGTALGLLLNNVLVGSMLGVSVALIITTLLRKDE